MVPAERARINITITFELVQEDRPCVNKKEGDQVARDDPCHYCHDSCFWERAELQVWENKQATMLAPLGHRYADLQCGDQHQYKLLSGTDHFEVRGSELWSRAMLDRDVVPVAGAQGGPGPAVVLAVECRTSWGVVEQRNVSVVVLDEDDNAPELEKPDERLEFNFSTEASLARGAHILVKDMDSRAANRFSDLAVDDPSGVVTSKKLEFDVSHGGVPHTVVSVRLQVKDPMATKYNVTLTLTDLTLLDESKRELKLTATLWGPPLTPPVAMSSSDKDKADKPRTRRRAREIKTLQKGEENAVPDKPVALAATSADGQPAPVTLWTHAAQHARVAQVGRAGDGRAYRLGSEPPAWANVTERAGILYVQNRSLLQQQKSPARVVVQILDDEGRSLLVPVTLEAGGGDSPRNCTLSHETTCGQFFNKAECHAGCGAGSGSGLRGECVWREAVLTDPKPFATCSPHLPTCPDGECDPLEALSEHVCPQDCTEKVLMGEKCEKKGNEAEARGLCKCLDHGPQVIECSDHHCACYPYKLTDRKNTAHKDKKKMRKQKTNEASGNSSVNSTTTTERAESLRKSCGSGCQAAIMSVIVVSLACVPLYAYCLNRYRSKRAPGLPERAGSEYQLHSVYRHDGGDLQAAAPPPRRTSNVDPRWEVHRGRLTLHEEIGAGEFGRVLRGELVSETHVSVTVAVKTLRASTGPGSPELRDLLSELELLKDVEHPNVIRLLGACTDPSGPLYVLLEYCSQGSLRGYLHRCRWSDKEDDDEQRKNKDPDDKRDEEKRPSMTPRKIIGFAWQIAKGMDYLGQLKLVHRDLASRNILLNENLVCKISDFGLSRDVYVDEAYCKLSAGKVPVKWMAPESLLMRVYTSKSDVWSFGVLLWELCTLGGAPYSGVAPHDMVALLAAGQRLARPEHCSRELHRVMQGCWQAEPQERPHFSQLVTILDGMLARGSGYLDLDARMVLNPEYFDEQQQPQLQRLCPPCGDAALLQLVEAPRYENAAGLATTS
ncbi:proto-oncogene tyrosine-protein kinase receptor Ret [Frankliniella occidentalis]|uniref:receptor protein-tyrosine kinase n=1 Tax=Frankliniella occidentalis TaxID=133901 RepID=A0A6J1SZT8_FRAOC|nr:proto-oncogene tyrosine-protein kinase receptor Ret [Frankliniella occidentalis]